MGEGEGEGEGEDEGEDEGEGEGEGEKPSRAWRRTRRSPHEAAARLNEPSRACCISSTWARVKGEGEGEG